MLMKKSCLSYDVASGSDIMSCNKIDKPLMVKILGKSYDVHNNLRYIMTKIYCFLRKK